MMGIISTGAVVTGSERQGQPKSIQQGNREWTTVIQGVNAMVSRGLPAKVSTLL
jgi:hypothetical protein